MSKKEKAKSYCRDFNALITSSAVTKYLEPERKLDAPNEETLSAFERHIERSRYYVPLNDPSTTEYDIPAGIDVTVDDINHMRVKPAKEDTPRRWRVYYDTPDLALYRGGVELRIEFPKSTEHGHAKPYKQVIKLGKAATAEDPTFHRIEISGRLTKPIPSFDSDVLDGNKELEKFLRKHFDESDVFPLQLLTTARERLWCRPGGRADTIVEFGIDRGRAITVIDHRSLVLQIEPEVLHGNEAILEEIGVRLKTKFNRDLTPNYRSKPSPGYDHLASVLDGNPEAKAYLRTLRKDTFRIIKPGECPALFPSRTINAGNQRNFSLEQA